MLNKKIILLIKSFNSTEIRQFNKFIASPYYNVNKEVILVWKHVLHNIDDISKLEKTHLHAVLYPTKPYQDISIRNIIMQLKSLLENYLQISFFQKDAIAKKLVLVKQLHSRNIESAVIAELEEINTDLQAASIQNASYLYQTFTYQQLKQEVLHTQFRNKESNLDKQLDALEKFYLAEKLKIMNLMMAHENVLKVNYSITNSQNVLELASTTTYNDIPAIQLFQLSYLCFQEFEREELFASYEIILFENLHFFQSEEQRMLLMAAINYCIKKNNLGKPHYQANLLELYKKGIASKVLFENGYLTQYTYSNVISLCLNLKDYDFVKNFIENDKKYLEESIQAMYYLFNKAKYLYVQKDYKAAIRILTQNSFSDPLINVSAKMVLLKIYYEQQEWDILDATLENISMYIRRELLMGYQKDSFINFVKYIKILARSISLSSKRKEKIKQEITILRYLSDRKWLVEQVEIK